ncbi:pirin family protein [Flammeovirga aprica]|uniref:Pirin family protein n=1 Tax=Flammeovirga aprica JL-4 TaxID=694437 RepID=A0A7X9RR24_9BACT|nr:pirin family protein [Flammeovirga aprica]NME67383.1 pirin family protein [Flammeovirga aprica JL-4]
MLNKEIKSIQGYANIDGLIPGVRGQRAFPTNAMRTIDPFLMLDHIGPEKVGKDFSLNGEGHDHPHRGFETITFMFEGKMNHRDSLGNRAELKSGGVQLMNAGAGIIHGGDMFSDPDTERFHEVQLWINNPKEEKLSAPGIQNLAVENIPVVVAENSTLRVISGQMNDLEGEIKTKASTQIGHWIGSTKSKITGLKEEFHFMVYVLEGEVRINNDVLYEFQTATLSDTGNQFEISTEEGAQVLILGGLPLQEPVVYGGPFVMSSQEEITQANIDYQKGLFGEIK